MPPQAFAILFMFLGFSVLLAVVAVRLVARLGGPRSWAAYLLPFGRLRRVLPDRPQAGGLVGPEIGLFGFQVAIFGDLALGLRGRARHGRCPDARRARPRPPPRAVCAGLIQARRDRQAPGSAIGHVPGASPVATGIPIGDQSLYEPG